MWTLKLSPRYTDVWFVNTERKIVRDCLSRAISEYSTNVLSAKMMSRLATESQALFAMLGLEILLTATETPGYRHLAILLVQQHGLCNRLANPALFSRAQAVSLATRLIAVDPLLDLRFAHQLPSRNGATPDTLVDEFAERALEILDEISPGPRVVPILNHLTRDVNPKISSRAALLVGKRVQSVAFVARLIEEATDPRVRGNAVESLWGNNHPEATKLFWKCVEDRQNRVVGNAIVGLFLGGEDKVVGLLKRLAQNSEPEFRMTSAWTIGRTGGTEFLPELSPLIKDDNPKVRATALRSLQTIRQIERLRRPSAAPAETLPVNDQPIPTVVPEPFLIDVRLDGSHHSALN